MKFHDPQIAVAAVGHVLIVGKNLIYQVSVHAEIAAPAGSVLASASHFMAAQHQTDVTVLPGEL